ncbi:MAG: hypothetical protein PUF72_07810 [Clostridiales bacterium]|nr:hypothetical protein [Clostridiales bacterium]
MQKLKKGLIFLIAAIFMISTFVPVYAEDTASSSGGGASSGGVDGGVGGGVASGGGGIIGVPSFPAYVEMSKIKAKGTICLPDGFAAPDGGLQIYGGFGSVELNSISAASVFSADSTEDTTEYEKIDVIATIPAGENSVEFEKTFEISSSADGFYGRFWIYDTNVISQDGERYISNKMSVSNIIKLKANKNEYSDINVTLSEAENKIDYSITFDEALKDEAPQQSVFVIADDGYDKYITRQDFNRCDAEICGSFRTENEIYELKYYIPKSDLLNNQRVETGTFSNGEAAFDVMNNIVINPQVCISGEISRPDTTDPLEELKIGISTSEATVNITIEEGKTAARYIVAAGKDTWEYVKVDILNSDFYKSGYFDGTEICDYYRTYTYITESLTNVDLPLQRQCVISGKIELPSDIVMSEQTYFYINMEIESTSGSYCDYKSFNKYSDKDAYYKFYVPYEYKDESFIISYDYGTYESVLFPTSAKNPLPYYYRGASSGGGGGGTGPVYVQENPEGLQYGRRIYCNSQTGTFYEEQAAAYVFDNCLISTDITLAKDGEIFLANSIGGYFVDVLSQNGGDADIILLDADTKNERYKKTLSGGDNTYIFDGLEDGAYIISAQYNQKTYYYTGSRLSTNVNNAKIIDTEYNPVNYGNDMYYDNIFPTNIDCLIDYCIINGEETEAKIEIFDIYGNRRYVYNSYDTIHIPFSQFVMSINGKFVSKYGIYGRMYIYGLTDKFDEASVVTARYVNTLESSLAISYNQNYINIDVVIEDDNYDYSINNASLEGNYIVSSINKREDNQNVDTIYYAAYNDGILTHLISDKLSLTKGTTEVKVPLPWELGENTDVKIFIWNDLLMPAAQSAFIEY